MQGLEILKSVVVTLDVRQVDLAAAEKVIEREEGGAARKRQAELQQSITDLGRLAPTPSEQAERTALANAVADRDTALAKVGSPLLRELYETARTIVADAGWPDPKRCPVCESTLTRSLNEHLQERIAQYAAADAANEAIERAVLRAASIARLERLETASALTVPAAERMHAAIIRAARDHILATAEINAGLARLDVLEAKRKGALSKARADLGEIEKTLPPSLVAVARMIASVKQFCDAIAAHKNARAALTERNRALAVRERWRKFIGSVVQAFSAAEAGLANARIAGLQIPVHRGQRSCDCGQFLKIV
jgi:hypothetical protein